MALGGSWTIVPLIALADGVHTVTARAIDAAGNISAPSNGLTLAVDTAPPTLTITSDVAKLKIGETATISFTFSEDPGATFTNADINVQGGTLGLLTGTGLTRTAVFTPSAGIDSGTANISVAAGSYTDVAGNGGGGASTPSLTFDTRAPAAPSTPDLVAASDTGTSNDDNITGDTTPTFTGTAESGSTVTLYADGNAIGSAVAVNGFWNIESSIPFAAGSYFITAKVTDNAGNVGPESQALQLNVVTVSPSTKVQNVVFSADTGWSTTDHITQIAAQTISGTLDAPLAAGETVQISLDGGANWNNASAAGSAWSYAAILLPGSQSLLARVTNAVGNAGPLLTTDYKLDTVAPSVSISTDVSVLKGGQTAIITFEFSEDPGNTFTWDGRVGDVVVRSGVLSEISGTGATRTATFTPDAGIQAGSATISISAGAYADAAGNFGGPSTLLPISYDTLMPIVTVNIVDTQLTVADQVSDVIFTFSEAPWDFTLQDLVVTGGTLTNFVATADPLVYTALFEANQNFAGSGSITVKAGSYVDAAGNLGAAGSDAVSIDTLVPSSPPSTPNEPNTPIVALPEGGVLVGTSGDDQFLGSSGLDYVQYDGGIADYRIITDALGNVVGVEGPDGADTFDGIERLVFSDGILAFDEPAKQSYRLYGVTTRKCWICPTFENVW